jgi:hypothetical protein
MKRGESTPKYQGILDLHTVNRGIFVGELSICRDPHSTGATPPLASESGARGARVLGI